MSIDLIALWVGYLTIAVAAVFGATIALIWLWEGAGQCFLYILRRILSFMRPIEFPSYGWARGRFYKIGPTFTNGRQSRNIGFWITYSREIADTEALDGH